MCAFDTKKIRKFIGEHYNTGNKNEIKVFRKDEHKKWHFFINGMLFIYKK